MINFLIVIFYLQLSFVCCIHSGFAPYLKNSKFGTPTSFIMGCKQSCLALDPMGDIIFILLESKQNCLMIHRERLYPPKLFAKLNSWREWSRTKAVSAHKTCRNVRDSWRFVSQHATFLLSLSKYTSHSTPSWILSWFHQLSLFFSF